MARPIRHVTVVGGGTAGWLTASALLRAVTVPGRGSPISVTLIESPTIPTVGVGEAALPALHSLIEFLGFDEREFVRRTQAAIKLGARFVNWTHGPKGEAMDFVNIMNRPEDRTVGSVADYFLAFHPERNAPTAGRAYTRLISPASDMIDRYLGPVATGGPLDRSVVNYSYHFDSGELAKLMEERAKELGAEHILDDVDDAEIGDNGLIGALTLRERGRHPVELVIDCTGFRSDLLGRRMKVPFESYSKHLLNDRALIVQFPHEDPTRIEPVTRLTAMTAGWSFKTPLFNRVGTGYVFSSRFATDDQALDEMSAFLGPAMEGATTRFVPMKLGHYERHWVGNCVAVGLSSGFIEPMEATAIYLAQKAVNFLLKTWPTQDYEPVLAQSFDRAMNRLYDEVRDFIVLHFHLNNRVDTPYWIAAREEAELPDSLARNLEVWRHKLPVSEDLASEHVFSAGVYALVLIAKNFYQGRDLPTRDLLSQEVWKHSARQIASQRDESLKGLMDHYRLLCRIRGETPRVGS